LGEKKTFQFGVTPGIGVLSGVYILENTLSPLGAGISANVIWGKNMKRQREEG
jgi:hypothetical protein